jgi:hypothetical protein
MGDTAAPGRKHCAAQNESRSWLSIDEKSGKDDATLVAKRRGVGGESFAPVEPVEAANRSSCLGGFYLRRAKATTHVMSS